MAQLFHGVAVWSLALSMLAAANAMEAPGARSIPGVTSADTHPEGCVSCHIDMPDIGVDGRLSTSIREWERQVPADLIAIARRAADSDLIVRGKHPPVPLPLVDVPYSCIACHQAASKSAPPFSRLLHLVHYGGGNENHFLTQFGGECTLCHKLDLQTGRWTLPSGPER